MIEIGTSGWVYPHWIGRFYPPELPAREQLSYYAQHFSTVEINRSFYRLPTYDQFRVWAEQTSDHPNFRFAVKASRYITHLKKLHNVEEGVQRLVSSAQGLGTRLGPFLYQLPPHWRANPERLGQFIKLLPPNYQTAFEFRDPTWFEGETLQALSRMLNDAGCALAVGIGGSSPTPTDIPGMGPFRYYRFHHGAHGIGFSDDELIFWAKRFVADGAEDRDVYVYFNNDLEAYAIHDALRLRELLAQVQG